MKRILYFLIPVFYVLHFLSLMISMAGMEFFGWGGLLLVVIAEIYERTVNKKTLFVSHPFNKYVIIFGLALTISVLFSPYLSETDKPWHFYLGRLRYLLLFFFHTTVLTYFVDIKRLLKWLPAFMLPILLLYIFESSSGTKIFKGDFIIKYWDFANGVVGYFVHYIEYATIFEMFLFLLIPLLFFSGYGKKYKAFLFVTILVLLFSLAVSGTRAFFVALPVGLLAQAIFSKSKKPFLVIIASILVVSFVAYKSNRTLRSKVTMTVSNIQKAGDPYRYNLWKAHFLMFKDHKITGSGYYVATDPKFIEPYYKKLNIEEKDAYKGLTHAHNNYLDILSGTGLIGFISFILFIFMLLKYIFSARRMAIKNWLEYEELLSLGLIGVMACLLTNMMIDTSLQMIKVCYNFMFITGIAIYLHNKLRKLS